MRGCFVKKELVMDLPHNGRLGPCKHHSGIGFQMCCNEG
jgi:hypothetical protein